MSKLKRFLQIEIICFVVLILLYLMPRIRLAMDNHIDRCLPNIKAALLVETKPGVKNILSGDLIFWRPYGPLSYVNDEFIVKEVVGVEGDFLSIEGETIKLNNITVATGLPNSSPQEQRAHKFDRSETIPEAQFFVLGHNPLSYDSRYWGYVPYQKILGRAIAVF